MGKQCPSETAYRKLLPQLSKESLSFTKWLLKDEEMFLLVDECDVNRTKYFGILVGDASKFHLFDCIPLTENLSGESVALLIDDTIRKLEVLFLLK